MVQLQKPEWVYFAGKIRPWDEAVLHVSCEAVTRGLNVFEGLKGYWHKDGIQLRHRCHAAAFRQAPTFGATSPHPLSGQLRTVRVGVP